MDGINISAECIIKIENIKEEPIDYEEEYILKSTEEEPHSPVQLSLKSEHDAGVQQDPDDHVVEQIQNFTDPSVMYIANFDDKGAWSIDGECDRTAFTSDVTSRGGCSFEMRVRTNDRTHLNSALRYFQPPYECVSCQKIYRCKRSLLHHRLRFHGGDPLSIFQCPACRRSFLKISYLVVHMRIHSDEQLHKCSVCQKSFKLKSTLKKHMRIHNSGYLHECSVCQMTFAGRSSLKMHLQIHKCHKCPVCQKTYKYRSALVNHMCTHGSKRPFLRQHSECKKSSIQKDTLVRHKQNPNTVPRYACSVCQRSFRLKSTLVRHKKFFICEHPHQSHKCSECQKGFVEKDDLVRHMQIHNCENIHECSVCQKSFKMRDRLERHMNIHNRIPYECSVCQKTFTLRDRLIGHMRFHDTVVPYECPICQKIFNQRRTFIKHKRTHNFECRLPKEICS